MNFRILFLSLFSVLFLTFSTASAQQSPEEFVTSLMEQAKEISNLEEWHDAAPVEREREHQRLKEDALLYLIERNFDIKRVGRFVLGRYWRRATFKQQNEFLDVFKLAAVRTFSPLLKDVPLDTFKIVRIQWSNSDMIEVFVFSTIEPEKNKTIKIRWRLWKAYSLEGYKVIDITAEGVSLIVTLRSEYTSFIKRNGGIDSLITELRKKANEKR